MEIQLLLHKREHGHESEKQLEIAARPESCQEQQWGVMKNTSQQCCVFRAVCYLACIVSELKGGLSFSQMKN